MKQRFYLDTAIWRDYFEDRKDRLQPLGEFAFQFLKNCEKHNYIILYSPLVLHELYSHYSDERVNEVFSSFANLLQEVKPQPGQLTEAKKINRKIKDSHTADILHAILARDSGSIMITRDKHFEALTSVVEVLKPEEVTFG